MLTSITEFQTVSGVDCIGLWQDVTLDPNRIISRILTGSYLGSL